MGEFYDMWIVYQKMFKKLNELINAHKVFNTAGSTVSEQWILAIFITHLF